MPDEGTPLGVMSTITALGQTQLSRPGRPSAPPAAANAVRYSRVETLGRGGMGIVDRVWDGDLMRDVAVKRLRGELRDDPGMVAQFLWEARVGSYLDHPNIVPVHDLGMEAEGPYFTMKCATGRSLAAWLADADVDQRLPFARRLRVLHQVCQAVAFAHRRGVLHRDLKPANVLLGDDGEVLVTDWGLAIAVPGAAGEPLRPVMPEGLDAQHAGTPLYMSPEQVRGDVLDERSDVFSLGVMLYEIATRVQPFAGSTVSEITTKIARGEYRPLREVWLDVPRSFDAVVARAMAREPADRYATAGALALDLERVIDGATPSAERASYLTQAARYYLGRDRAIQRMRMVDIDLWVVSGILMGIAVGALFAGWLGAWWWLALAAGLLVGAVPTARFVAERRSERASLRSESRTPS